MKKYIMLSMIILLCFGCKAKYNIVINKDLSVNEKIVALEDENFYKEYYNSSKERVIKFALSSALDYLNKNNYTRNVVEYDDYAGAVVETTFDSIKDYFERSKASEQLYKNNNSSINGKNVKIDLKEILPKNNNVVDRYSIDECEVTIELPFKVIKNNADKVDKKKNKYSWNLKTGEEKDIYIEFNTNSYVNVIDKVSNYFLIILPIFVLLIIIIFYKKKRKSNKI